MAELALFAVAIVSLALIFVYVLGRVEKRNEATASRVAASDKLPSLMHMSADERLDEQRKLITDGARTFPVEFFATVNGAVLNRANYSEHTTRKVFGSEVEKALRGWLPLGGRIHILPVTSVSELSVSATTTLRCVAYLETRYAVDAHEVAERACGAIKASPAIKDNYGRVAFLPVVMDSPPTAGHCPGLWDVTFVGESDLTYGHVVTRKGDATAEPYVVRGEWKAAYETLDRVTREFAEFEFSPMDVALTRRLLWDLTEPATARFYEAFDAANMLLTDNEPSDTDTVTAFVEASRVAVTAWEAADRNARNKAEQNIVAGGAVLSSSAVKHRDTAASAMRLALDEGTPAPEAGLAWRKATEALTRAGMEVPSSWHKKMESTEVVSRALKALPAGGAQ